MPHLSDRHNRLGTGLVIFSSRHRERGSTRLQSRATGYLVRGVKSFHRGLFVFDHVAPWGELGRRPSKTGIATARNKSGRSLVVRYGLAKPNFALAQCHGGFVSL